MILKNKKQGKIMQQKKYKNKYKLQRYLYYIYIYIPLLYDHRWDILSIYEISYNYNVNMCNFIIEK